MTICYERQAYSHTIGHREAQTYQKNKAGKAGVCQGQTGKRVCERYATVSLLTTR